ncbi:MAG: NADH-quinone oxidoreductase subunit NuoK [Cytophagales bacterium]|nr:NADH-quinone oxidoreductase subunit NuoK [Cytophagales bacterium]
MDPVTYLLSISAFLFCVGLAIVITKKNAILLLIGIELMLNAANLNFIVFSSYDVDAVQGQLFVLFILVVTVCEVAIGLAIILKIYQYYQTIDIDRIKRLKEE